MPHRAETRRQDVSALIPRALDTSRTALVGSNGVGKTTLAKFLSGELDPTAGTIKLFLKIFENPQLLVKAKSETVSHDCYLQKI